MTLSTQKNLLIETWNKQDYKTFIDKLKRKLHLFISSNGISFDNSKILISFDLDELDFEDKNRVLGNFSNCTRTVSKLWRNLKFTNFTDAHSKNSSIPSFDNLPRSKRKSQRLFPFRRIKNCSIQKGSSVVYVE